MSEFRSAPVLVLDLDGTVRFSKNGPFVNKAEDIGIYPDVMPKINAMMEEGFLPIFVTNQGGVAFGYTTVNDVQESVMKTIYLLAGKVAMAFSAFGHVEGTVEPFRYRSLHRKPEIGMLAMAEAEMMKNNVFPDWDASVMVGDRPEDEECARRAGIRFQWAWEFFNRPHPDEGRSPFCTYCNDERQGFNCSASGRHRACFLIRGSQRRSLRTLSAFGLIPSGTLFEVSPTVAVTCSMGPRAMASPPLFR